MILNFNGIKYLKINVDQPDHFPISHEISGTVYSTILTTNQYIKEPWSIVEKEI